MQCLRFFWVPLVLADYLARSADAPAKDYLQPTIAPQAEIYQNKALEIALHSVPNRVLKTVKLEREHRITICLFDVAWPRMKEITGLCLNALSGDIAGTAIEILKNEARKASSDQTK